MWVDAPDMAAEAQPGQYIMARCTDGVDPLFRRPMSIHRIGSPAEGEQPRSLALLYGVAGAGTSLLARFAAGSSIDLVGPLGNGFSIAQASHNILMVGGGLGISPLVGLAYQLLQQKRQVVLLEGASTSRVLFPRETLPEGIQIHSATVDGSSGVKGMVTDLVAEHWGWADQIFCCGPFVMYPSLAKVVAPLSPRKSIQVLVDTPIVCGIGACDACTIETLNGPRQACVDGTSFELSDLM